MKKVLSLLLAVVMMFSIAAPAASAVETADLPTVYIEGQGTWLARSDGTVIYPLDVDWLSVVMNDLMPMWKEVVQGVATGDYSPYCEKLYGYILPLFADIKLGKDGLPTDGSTVTESSMWRGKRTLDNIKDTIPLTNGEYNVYRWHYDFRLSPLDLSEELDQVIDAVLAQTGARKVNIISRCLGSAVAYTYLMTKGTDKVASCTFYSPSVDGIGMASALFTGEVKLDAGSIDRFVNYFRESSGLVIGDELTTELLMALVELLDEIKVLGFGLDIYQKIVDEVQKEAFPKILIESFGTCPGYWTMVTADKYEQAKNFVFGNDADGEWAELIAKTDAYYNIQKDSKENLQKLSDKINIAVISKYGLPMIPLSEDSEMESDVFVSTTLSSFDAKTSKLETKFSDKYINKAKKDGTDKYISADRKVDASTCALPDTTWFIKDLGHKEFPDCVNDLIVAFIESNGTMTVDSNPEFTQYLQFTATNNSTSDSSRGTMAPIRTMSDTHDTTETYKNSPLNALKKFVGKLILFLIKLVKDMIVNKKEG